MGTSYNSKFFKRNRSKTPRVVKIFVSIFLLVAWTGSVIGIWWDIGQIQEKGMFEITDPECFETDAFISEMQLKISDLEQQTSPERVADLKDRLANYEREFGEEESDCYRSGIILIVAGAFILISVPLIIVAVTRSRRKGKTDFNPPNSKRREKESDPFSDSDDFDNPIFS